MSEQDPIKLIPRNVAALRRGQKAEDGARLVSGNPATTRLESGVGNCFPGLECDLRNLERRFFPFLEVDLEDDNQIRIVSVDLASVQTAEASGAISSDTATDYTFISEDMSPNQIWRIRQIRGTFGPLGQQTILLANLSPPSFGPNRLPPDAWSAIRLLTEGTDVEITAGRGNVTRTLAGKRATYLDDNGALAKMFLPGELTQSLCSPWTHDFRDCGCFYWASNHPDIALPPVQTVPPNTSAFQVAWQRVDRSLTTAPQPATSGRSAELRYYEINQRWQTLNFVIEGRELLEPYEPGKFVADPFATEQELIAHLRYAAGVELAVIHEYLAAAYSFRRTGLSPILRDDVIAAHAELMRIAFSEMRHLRAVNDVLMTLTGGANFTPALQVTTRVPTGQPGVFRNVQPRPATPQTIQDFINIERPSISVDGLYSRILITLEKQGSDQMEQTIRSIMSEGTNHFDTFRFIQEWLTGHNPADYLRVSNVAIPPAANAAHAALQQKYRQLLDLLFAGYSIGLPAGASQINTARTAMLGNTGLDGAAEAVASQGFLVMFDTINDPRFAPINPPLP